MGVTTMMVVGSALLCLSTAGRLRSMVILVRTANQKDHFVNVDYELTLAIHCYFIILLY
jgi:hypothetical protein